MVFLLSFKAFAPVFNFLLVISQLNIVGAFPQPTYGDHWVDTWVSMPQLTEPANLPPPPFVRA
jgi:hypothetical protein